MTVSRDAVAKPSLSWMESVRADLVQVTEKMRAASFLDNDLIDAALTMILASGGKRMRPSITLLVGRAVDTPYSKLMSVAASVELLHTATLVHDDLVDNADERRGTPTMHTKLPLGVTVLTGDFLFAQSAALAAEAESVPVVQVFSDALVNICRGEILQAQTRWKVPDLALYQQRIYGKTAALFQAAALSPALLSPDDDTSVKAFKSFGREVGMAYQIVDDALDFMATTETLGKPAGHDLREGHITLPAMLYIADNDIAADDFVAEARDKAKVGELIRVIREEKAPQRALQVAHEHIENAKAVLSDVKWSPAVDELIELADYVIARDF